MTGPARPTHASPGDGMQESKSRFLIIRLSSIGDIVHALPAVAALGETFPQAQIDWVVERRYAQLLEGNPFLRRVIKLDTLGWRGRLGSAGTIQDIARGLKSLREMNYDAAIDFQRLWILKEIGDYPAAPDFLSFFPCSSSFSYQAFAWLLTETMRANLSRPFPNMPLPWTWYGPLWLPF